MSQTALTLAFAAGTLAAVNPCGFALLPAYLTLFVSAGGDPRDDNPGGGGTVAGRRGPKLVGTFGPLRRAAVATAAMTLGFVVVFGTFALLVSPFALSVERWLPWATVAIGVALAGVGSWLLAGHQLSVRTPRLGGRRDPTSSWWAMAGYGVSFAVASLSCTVGPFLAVTTTAFRDDSIAGVTAVFLAYALGMGAVVGALTLGVALSREALVFRLRSALPYVTRVGGALLIVAGVYAAYYGWYEIRILRGGSTDDPIIETAIRWQSDLSRAVAELSAVEIFGGLAVFVALVGLVGWSRGRGRSHLVGPAPGSSSATSSTCSSGEHVPQG